MRQAHLKEHSPRGGVAARSSRCRRQKQRPAARAIHRSDGRTRLSFEGNKVVSAAWTKFQEGGRAEVDGAEAGWRMYEDAHTAPTGAKVLECWFDGRQDRTA